MGSTKQTEDRYEQSGLHMLHTATQEKHPSDPSSDPTYIKCTRGNENIRSPTTHQVARPHFRLETLVAKPPEYEDPVQRLRTASAIVRGTSVVERQEKSSTKD